MQLIKGDAAKVMRRTRQTTKEFRQLQADALRRMQTAGDRRMTASGHACSGYKLDR